MNALLLAHQQILRVTLLASDPTTGITAWLGKVQGWLKTLSWSLCGVVVMILGIVFLVGGKQAFEKGKSMGINIVIGIGIISFGLGVVTSLKGG
ncbi:MAG: hypothetical protein QM689_01630 [Oscillospiraceae bacterium]